MNKITIKGWNYEGAHFRGIASDTDGVTHSITLVYEDERSLVDWILYSYSYGNDDDGDAIQTLEEMIAGYKNLDISNGDGCGCIGQLIIDGKIVYQMYDEINEAEYFGSILEMGEHVISGPAGIDTLNDMIAQEMGK